MAKKPRIVYAVPFERGEVESVSRRAEFHGETTIQYIKRLALEDAAMPVYRNRLSWDGESYSWGI